MIPSLIPPHTFAKQTRLSKIASREAGSLTTYLREKATPEEKDRYNRSTQPGSKAGTAPRTIAQLKALVL